jgi:hypothetical protein
MAEAHSSRFTAWDRLREATTTQLKPVDHPWHELQLLPLILVETLQSRLLISGSFNDAESSWKFTTQIVGKLSEQ